MTSKEVFIISIRKYDCILGQSEKVVPLYGTSIYVQNVLISILRYCIHRLLPINKGCINKFSIVRNIRYDKHTVDVHDEIL